VFKSALGYDRWHAQILANQIVDGIKHAKAAPGAIDVHGTRFSVDVRVVGFTGDAIVLSQVVELTEDFPAKGVTRGTLAAVVAVFDQPFEPEAYEIEVVNESGDTLAEFTVSPAQICPLNAHDLRTKPG